jgi:hypothetical protein
MIKAICALHRDLDTVAGVGAELAARYGGADMTPEVEAAMRKQAAKRVGLEFVARETPRGTTEARRGLLTVLRGRG